MRIVHSVTQGTDGTTRNQHTLDLWAVLRKALSIDFSFSATKAAKSVFRVGVWLPPCPYAGWHHAELGEIKDEFRLDWLLVERRTHDAAYAIDSANLLAWCADLQQMSWLQGTYDVKPFLVPSGRYYKGSEFEKIECGGVWFRVEEP